MNQPELQLRKNNTDMDVWEHVGELRRRLIRCVAAVALAFAVLVYIGPERVMNAVAAPVKEQGVQLIYLGLADALYVQLKVVFLCAVVLAAPVGLCAAGAVPGGKETGHWLGGVLPAAVCDRRGVWLWRCLFIGPELFCVRRRGNSHAAVCH